jgi:predicted metal-dependent phosphoesterase TrpH
MAEETVRTNLHNHTNMSDGSDHPFVSALNLLRHVSHGTISDHDTTKGWETIIDTLRGSKLAHFVEFGLGYLAVDPASIMPFGGRMKEMAQRMLGLPTDLGYVKVYHGIELTVDYQGKSVHLLGLGVDTPPPHVRARLNHQMQYRYDRLKRMTDEINERQDGIFKGVTIPYEGKDGVRDIAGESESPTRIHVGEALRRAGYCSSAREGMEKYLSTKRDNPYWLKATAFDHSVLMPAGEGIEAIRVHLRGAVGLAHPERTARSLGMDIETLVRTFTDMGVEFLDANSTLGTSRLDGKDGVRLLTAIADKHGLFVTGGHDTHGDYDDESARGQRYVEIPRRNIDRLEQNLADKKGTDSVPSDEPHI